MDAGNNPVLPGPDDARPIHLQAFNSCAACRRHPLNQQAAADPLKVIAPIVQSRIKQTGRLTAGRVNPCNRRAFTQVTTGAGKAQIVRVIPRIWIDMVNMHRLANTQFKRPAVFTITASTLIHQPAGRCPGRFTHENSDL